MDHFKVLEDALAPLELKKMNGFSKIFLITYLGGVDFSVGFYYNPTSSILTNKTYMILDASVNPWVPLSPGKHGVRISPFLQDIADFAQYQKFPVFVAMNTDKVALGTNNAQAYHYMGDYTIGNWSERIGFDRHEKIIPEVVKDYWGRQLAGSINQDWPKTSLGLEDDGAQPGLRFHWEYLECAVFDRSFYYSLVTKQNDFETNANNFETDANDFETDANVDHGVLVDVSSDSDSDVDDDGFVVM